MVACISKTLKSNFDLTVWAIIQRRWTITEITVMNMDKDIRRSLVYAEQELSGWHPIFPPDGID